LESADRLHALLAESDCVAVCCQWTPETTNLIDREAFAAMKPGAILSNVARGEIIDEEALVVALNQGKLRGSAWTSIWVSSSMSPTAGYGTTNVRLLRHTSRAPTIAPATK